MARQVRRPVILPLSNPVSRSKATPADLMAWTDGRAVIGTGSPFPPVERNGRPVRVAQTNNAYVFPGVGLGLVATRSRRATEGMFMAAARALAEASPARLDPGAPLLPPVADLRDVSARVAVAVGEEAHRAGLSAAEPGSEEIETLVRRKIWVPDYRPYAPSH